MSLQKLQREAWEIAESKGFHEGKPGQDRDTTLLRLCLVHTEISEAAQEVKRHWSGELTQEQKLIFAEELADATIRILDLAECVGVSLQDAIDYKMIKNQARPHRYGTPQARELVNV